MPQGFQCEGCRKCFSVPEMKSHLGVHAVNVHDPRFYDRCPVRREQAAKLGLPPKKSIAEFLRVDTPLSAQDVDDLDEAAVDAAVDGGFTALAQSRGMKAAGRETVLDSKANGSGFASKKKTNAAAAAATAGAATGAAEGEAGGGRRTSFQNIFHPADDPTPGADSPPAKSGRKHVGPAPAVGKGARRGAARAGQSFNILGVQPGVAPKAATPAARRPAAAAPLQPSAPAGYGQGGGPEVVGRAWAAGGGAAPPVAASAPVSPAASGVSGPARGGVRGVRGIQAQQQWQQQLPVGQQPQPHQQQQQWQTPVHQQQQQ
eukprot:Rhum_TRINITY_DN8263_c0_g1::Rhum_TRINITY_DN8263_c0_g1_i1::g.26984::m.26984